MSTPARMQVAATSDPVPNVVGTATGGPVPDVVGTWNVTWPTDSSQSLPTSLTVLQIDYQAPGTSFDQIFGSLSSMPPNITSYALRDGTITRLNDESLFVFFVLRVNSEDQTFNGFLSPSGKSMKGKQPTVPFEDNESGDGSWSAQAQSGG